MVDLDRRMRWDSRTWIISYTRINQDLLVDNDTLPKYWTQSVFKQEQQLISGLILWWSFCWQVSDLIFKVWCHETALNLLPRPPINVTLYLYIHLEWYCGDVFRRKWLFQLMNKLLILSSTEKTVSSSVSEVKVKLFCVIKKLEQLCRHDHLIIYKNMLWPCNAFSFDCRGESALCGIPGWSWVLLHQHFFWSIHHRWCICR